MSIENIIYRPRRLRTHAWLRDLVQEHRLHASDLIWPIFIQPGEKQETPIASLPGVSRLSIKFAIQKAADLKDLGLKAVALFPVTPQELKNEAGDEALNENNLICEAIRAFKKQLPDMGLITDVALDPYTSHGHDGLVDKHGYVINDATVEILCKQAVIQAKAGADIIAPSDMMDGRVDAIRAALDTAGFSHVAILAYSAKYASAFYGPFRDAVGSAQNLNGIKSESADEPAMSSRSAAPCESQKTFAGANKKATYQMPSANRAEALKEAALDVAEGADMLMVKPGLPYLDIISDLSREFDLPVFAYHVSGEYAGVMFADQHGAVDAKAAFMEQMLCFKRAGATAILTYAAPILLEMLNE